MLTNAPLVYQAHDHSRCVNVGITQARQLCATSNKRLTLTREAILKLLWQSHKPLGAYQLQHQLAEITGKPIAPPTIYRAIEFLLELGLIHRLPSLNAFFSCPFPNSEHSHAFMICDQCQSVAEIADRQINLLLQAVSDKNNFKLHHKSIELFGLCPNCRTEDNRE